MGADHRPAPAVFPPSQICLFLDIDGTLVEFAKAPDEVRVDAEAIGTLTMLEAALDGALALISGRPLADVDRLVQPLHLPAAGLHGLERRDAGGCVHRPDVQGTRLQPARASLREFVASHPGLLLEDKSVALAVHYRAAPQLKQLVQVTMAKAAVSLLPEFALLAGDMVMEIKPARFDKAAAVEEFMREAPFAGRVPVFVGDDITDYDGFGAVRRHGGMTVAVGARVTAQWYLPDPRATRDWLARIATAGASNVG